ncbi:unnamed protein product [Ostreobium quekettii]|uniref:Uncharacterized protein n=1 Tax=Ostreobium quekettii TaxID=121088 RepID=A0A8S1JCV6_9CHLO|nr:unnamed protein product [Ostreobium quekettii]
MWSVSSPFPCKVPKTSSEQNPSGAKDVGINGNSKQHANGGAEGGAPLQPMTVNEGPARHQDVAQPSAKEIAAAKAARIRLGLEKDDGTLAQPVEVSPKLPSGVERKVDIEYVATADLQPLADSRKAAEVGWFQSDGPKLFLAIKLPTLC